MPRSRTVPSLLLALASVVLTGPGDTFAATAGQRCEKDAAKAVSSCFRTVLAQSTRLKAVPDQQILVVTNQVDSTQVATTNFPSVPAFVNELRSSYCDIQGAPGVHSFLYASNTTIHGMINDVSWNDAAIGGSCSATGWGTP